MDPQKPYKFVVRLPLQLRHQIGDAAQYYRRSMNSEIVARLEQSFSGLPTLDTTEQIAPAFHDELESFFGRALAPEEEKIVRAYRRLSQEKKLALLELIN
jgi:Arc-like DNA binding dprotein